jgi:ATP-dependent Clp protease, protease subunit|tara:strand:- start:9781 stop:10374 length:594 start_codon:yes stop_codon:yes gene_type:complete
VENTVLKVNYGDMPGMNKRTQLFFKNLEWGINIKSNTMYLTYEIEQDTLYAVMTRFDNFIQHNPNSDINLNIASYGGDVYSMLGIIDYFKTLPVKVNTHCVGACMSAAAVILACGTGERTMTENSTVMVHEGSAFEAGKTSDVLKGADHLKKLQSNINRIMADVTSKDQEFWERVSQHDTYLTAEECLDYGIVDKII